jgi:type I restriction enzyme S subunit
MTGLPPSWRIVSLNEICNPKQWPTISQTDFVEDGYPVYGANGKIGHYTEFNHERPAVLITCRGATCGTINVCEPKSYVTGNAMALDDLADSKVSREYLVYALRHDGLAKAITGTAQPQITRQSLTAISIPLPPLAQQRRIAAVLDGAEALRTKRRTALVQLDTFVQSLFLDALLQAGQSVPTVSIEDAMEVIIDYRGKSPRKTEKGVPLVTARIVQGGELLEPNEFIAEEDYDSWMRRGFPKSGDVLFTTEAPLGEVAQLDGRKVALAQRILVLRGKPSLLDNRFLKHALTAPEVRKQIDARATGSTVRGIRQRELRKVTIPVPPLSLQHRFARHIFAVEKLKAVHRSSLAEMDALFATLQRRAFRGEL